MTDSLISIVLPTYNGAKYLQNSIQSCLDQTHTNWELIIVDDCSTDNTPDIIASFEKRDPRIRSIPHEINRKLPASLNTGFLHAKGDFLTWTSDDNLYKPNALAVMLSFLQENPQIGLVYSDWDIIDSVGKIIGSHKVKAPERLVFGCIVGPCFMYRHKVLQQVGNYAEDLFFVEDYDYWLRTSIYFNLAPVNKILYSYRIHSKSLSASKNNLIGQRILSAKERSIPKMKWINYRQKGYAFLEMAISAWQLGKPIKVLKYLSYAFFYNPSLIYKSLTSVKRKLHHNIC